MYSNYTRRFPAPKMSQEQIEEEKRLRALWREQQEVWDSEDEDESSDWQPPQTPEEDEALMASLKRLIVGA